ncbi:HtaA domain-containing protein [Microbacterium trichothecenolyticum]|uniref:Htaa n=1 Tax=Microbacterium trichothecenolyticum TaxID=69370 RepID=A0A0M2HFI0_MICTR|nr:HtaA domain-containing protein [Microbacterium trichothecenolyticum]KJL45427.1 Htaa [Microbacterium trichothecenolyticum]
MNTQPFLDRSRASIAALLAFLLVVAGALTAVPAFAAGPSVSATQAPRAGGTITVTGSGFSGVAPGVYVGVGAAGLSGFYGGTMSDVVWVSPGNAEGSTGAGRTAPMTESGTFSVQLSVPAHAEGAQYTVYTSKAHGGGFTDPSQNASTAIAWQPLPAVATTTTLTVDPAASSLAGADFALGATVEPAASGTVSYFNGETQLGSAVVGTTITASIATAGIAQLTAVFTPADPAAFTGSTSSAVSYEITAPPVDPEPEAPAPTVTVSKTTGLDPDGETVTVSGSGFVPNPPATDGTRPPLAGKFGGSYIVFGKFLDEWTPSSGAPTSARPGIDTKWGVHAADVASIGGAARGGIAIAADGTFETTLTISRSEASQVLAGNYGVYTYSGAGAKYAAFETYTPITFAEPAPSPSLAVSKTEGLDPEGDTITITGTDYSTAGKAIYGPSAGQPAGVYAQIGWLEESWRPSAGAVSGQRSNAYSVWAQGVQTQAPYLKWTDNGDGTADFAWTVEIDEATLEAKRLEGATLAVFTVGAGGVVQAVNELAVPIAFADPTPVPAVDVTVTDASATAGATVQVAASNLGDVTGAYAAIIEKGTESVVTAGDGFAAMQYVRPISGGSFTVDLVAPAAKLDRAKQYEVIVWRQHSNPGADTIYARGDVPFTADHWTKLFPEVTPPTDPEPPVDPGTPATPPASVQGGSLAWAISSSFASYITGSIAHGSIAVTGGATRSGGVFQFGQATGSTYDATTGTGTVSYTGSVRFTGHGGVLDVTIANPQVRITSPNAATLYVTSGGSQVAFANLDLSAAVRVTANGTVSYSRVPATLTAAGRNQVFQGYTTELDPLAFTIGVPAAAPAGSTGTVAAAPASTTRTTSLPAAPPASTGIDLDDDTLAALQKGEPVTVSASGFTPNEEGIKVVVYSTPTLLGEVAADASGKATWTGSLPAALEDGEHTLTFQGSVDRGIRFTLARAAIAAGCFVEAATLDWGFKETFRTYIEGIAAGGWELTDVAYEYPEFVWTAGDGAVDAATRTGLVTYGGSIRFTGHQGALDTTLTNARVELAGDTGYLVFDVSGTTQAGEPVTAAGIRFAEFALPDLEVTDDGLVLDALPATLTDAGAAAFGTYAAGDELDPVSAVLPAAGDCAVAAAPVKAEEVPVAEAAEAEALSADRTTAPVWPWVLVGIALALGIGAVVWIVVSRRRATAGGNGDQTAG